MTELDNKLKELDLEFLHGVPVQLTDVMIEQIKQVFQECGWKQIESIEDNGDALLTAHVKAASDNTQSQDIFKGVETDTYYLTPDVMTGAEWLARFEKELEKVDWYTPVDYGTPYLNEDGVMVAAFKAAGIQE